MDKRLLTIFVLMVGVCSTASVFTMKRKRSELPIKTWEQDTPDEDESFPKRRKLEDSDENTVSGNTANGNFDNGIRLDDSNDNMIKDNITQSNDDGIDIEVDPAVCE